MSNPLLTIGMDSNRSQFMARQRLESQINLPRLPSWVLFAALFVTNNKGYRLMVAKLVEVCRLREAAKAGA